MKTAKRIASIVLALVLGMALLVPAGASDYINIELKKGPSNSVTVFTGDTLKLEIDVSATEDGMPVELECAWYDYAWQEGDVAEPIATGPKLEIPITTEMAKSLISNTEDVITGTVPFEDYLTKTYTVAVSRISKNDTGMRSEFLLSCESKVYIYPSVRDLPSVLWNTYLGIIREANLSDLYMALALPMMLGQIVFLTPLLFLFQLKY